MSELPTIVIEEKHSGLYTKHLFDLYYARLCYFAHKLIGKKEGAEDIVQDAFIQAYHAIRGFDATRPFEPWFMRSVVNAALKLMQRSARQIQVGDEGAESLLAEFSAQVESVEAQVESIEIQDQIWDAMQKLSPRQRAVIVQRYFLDMGEKEMAEDADSAVGTVKWMLNAARERLRSLLERSVE